MFVIRPISHADLGALETFSINTSIGLTSLPPDRSLLHQKILRSEHAFSKDVTKAGPELYQFVLEDTESNEVIGTCAIVARVGWKDPITFFQKKTELKKCIDLGFCKKHLLIEAISYKRGPSEVCTLYLASTHRKGGLGYLLSLCRFLFMACFPERFHERVIAQMRGVIDESGIAPFYESVTKTFFDVDFCELQDLLAVEKNFIKDLLPHRPIYLSLLPKEAREVVSQTHPKTMPALKLLQSEGFQITDDMDLFDAGPKLEALVSDVRTIKESVVAEIAGITEEPADSKSYILCNGNLHFRACLGHLERLEDGRLLIDAETAKLLQISTGALVRYIELRPRKQITERESWQETIAQQ